LQLVLVFSFFIFYVLYNPASAVRVINRLTYLLT